MNPPKYFYQCLFMKKDAKKYMKCYCVAYKTYSVYFLVSTPRFRSNEKFFWRPTRSTANDVTNFLIRPTRLPESKTVKNFFLMRPMKRNNVQKPFWLRPTRATMKWWSEYFYISNLVVKVHIFWEGHKILRNLHPTFVLCSASQK